MKHIFLISAICASATLFGAAHDGLHDIITIIKPAGNRLQCQTEFKRINKSEIICCLFADEYLKTGTAAQAVADIESTSSIDYAKIRAIQPTARLIAIFTFEKTGRGASDYPIRPNLDVRKRPYFNLTYLTPETPNLIPDDNKLRGYLYFNYLFKLNYKGKGELILRDEMLRSYETNPGPNELSFKINATPADREIQHTNQQQCSHFLEKFSIPLLCACTVPLLLCPIL
jgi:hypothetical protein